MKRPAHNTPAAELRCEVCGLMPEPPKARLTRAHHWLILHGRYTCVAGRPKCAECVVADLCPSREQFLGA